MKLAHLCTTILTALLSVGELTAGTGGNFDSNDDLTIHVYFTYDEDDSKFDSPGSTWQTYFVEAAKAYYNAFESKSKIKKIYIYNNLPEGKTKADVWIDENPNFGAWATPGTFGSRSGNVTLLNGVLGESGFGHRTLVHELGHYIYELGDCYGGFIGGEHLEWLPADQREMAKAQGWRGYMWSDSWLKRLVSPDLDGKDVFWNKGGDHQTSMMDGNGPEFAVDSTQVEEKKFTFKMPSYTYLSRNFLTGNFSVKVRRGDTRAKEYTCWTAGWDKLRSPLIFNWTSEWDLIADYHGWTMPTSTSPDTLNSADNPMFCIVGDVALAICLDRSGSMNTDNRIGLAKSGANVVINHLRAGSDSRNGHFAGVLSFDSSVTVDHSITEIAMESDRGPLRSAVNAMSAGGGTSIGAALSRCQTQLLTHSEKEKVIILLSDGQSGDNALAPVPSLIANDITVYTIAIGSGADTATLGSIASQTGGEMRASNSSGDTVRFFEELFSKLTGAGAATSTSASILPGEQFSDTAYVESGADRVTFSFVTSAPQMAFSIQDPSGTVYEQGTTDPNVSFRSSGEHRLFEVRDPTEGFWTVIIDNPVLPGAFGPFERVEDPPVPISNTLPAVTSTLQVADSALITELQVALEIRHTYVGDLEVTLTSPLGTSVTLHNRTGGSTDDLVGTYGTSLVPSQPLSAFNGEDVQGTWTLVVSDLAGGDEGTLVSWSVANGAAAAADEASVSYSVNSPEVLVDGDVSSTSVAFPDPVLITAGVRAEGVPVAGAMVYAEASKPDGSSVLIDLFDNGDPSTGDLNSGDGVYSALFNDYSGNGTYEFRVHCVNEVGEPSGYIHGGGPQEVTIPPFERQFTLQTTVSGVPPNFNRFFTIAGLNASHNPSKPNAGRMALKGEFSMPFDADFDFSTINPSVNVGPFARAYPGAVWKQAGRKPRFVYSAGPDKAQMEFWVGGSSKGKFDFKSSNANLSGVFVNPDSVPVSLGVGSLADTLSVSVDARGSSFRLGSSTPTPEFFVTTLSLSHGKTPGKDAIAFAGKATGPFSFDPLVHDFTLTIGSYTIAIPSGGWTSQRRTKLTFGQSSRTGPKVLLTYDIEKGTLTFKGANLDLSSMLGSNTAFVSLNLGGISGGQWTYQITMGVDRTGLRKRY